MEPKAKLTWKHFWQYLEYSLYWTLGAPGFLAAFCVYMNTFGDCLERKFIGCEATLYQYGVVVVFATPVVLVVSLTLFALAMGELWYGVRDDEMRSLRKFAILFNPVTAPFSLVYYTLRIIWFILKIFIPSSERQVQ